MTGIVPEPNRKEIVVCVDDEPEVLSALRRVFSGEAFELLTTESPREALEWVKSRDVGLVIADQRMPEMSGVELLEAVSRQSPTTARILLTAYPGTTIVLENLEQGLLLLIGKPWDEDELKRTVRKGLDLRAQGPPSGSGQGR